MFCLWAFADEEERESKALVPIGPGLFYDAIGDQLLARRLPGGVRLTNTVVAKDVRVGGSTARAAVAARAAAAASAAGAVRVADEEERESKALVPIGPGLFYCTSAKYFGQEATFIKRRFMVLA
jgi:hypothetical protein